MMRLNIDDGGSMLEPAMSSNVDPSQLTPVPRHLVDPEPPRPAAMARFSSRDLPTPLTSLVGRDAEVAAASTLLTNDRVRLLTLTGPGGVGKTRLSIQIGAAVAAAFPDGVVFVPLAPIVASELVFPTMARALGIRDSGGRPLFEAVADLLQQRRLLVILDNMEHLQEASPLLSTCSRRARA
jgi:hypothetical protein